MIKNKFYNTGNIGKRICLISDIHYSNNYDLNIFNQILENIRINNSDFICIPGDLVDDATILSNEKADVLTNFIKKLSQIAPVIIVRGNHDETYFEKGAHYIDSEEYFLSLNTIENVYYLNNKSLVRDNLCFTGVELSFDWYYNKDHENPKKFVSDFDSKITKIDIQKYNVLLCHTPSCVFNDDVLKKSKMINKFDLILSGHMHNGLVFKFLDGKSNRGFAGPFNDFLPKYAKGIATKEINNKKISLVICGGIIKFAENAPKLLRKLNFLYPINIDYIDI